MTPFRILTSPAAVLREDNIDTDAIFPGRFLLRMQKTGLAECLFHERRFTAAGAERADFVLNQMPWRDARILIAGRNFGCGSSREHAVWALHDFGIDCVIAESFGEIFAANCAQSGVLAVRLPPEALAIVAAVAARGERLTVDLERQRINGGGRDRDRDGLWFEIDPGTRQKLLNGWDTTALILNTDGPAIRAFEARHRAANPWLFLDDDVTDSLER